MHWKCHWEFDRNDGFSKWKLFRLRRFSSASESKEAFGGICGLAIREHLCQSGNVSAADSKIVFSSFPVTTDENLRVRWQWDGGHYFLSDKPTNPPFTSHTLVTWMAPFISLWIINILEFSGFSCHRFSICQRKHRERCLPIPRIPPDQGWHAASKELASGWKVKRIGSDRQSWRGKVFRQARQKCLQRWEAKNESRHRCKVSSKLFWDFYKKFEAGGDNFLHIW